MQNKKLIIHKNYCDLYHNFGNGRGKHNHRVNKDLFNRWSGIRYEARYEVLKLLNVALCHTCKFIEEKRAGYT